MGNLLDPFILNDNDIIGLMQYRIRCGRERKEGVVIDTFNDKSYLVLVDGSFENNVFPEVCDKLDELLGEILNLKYAYYDEHQKLRS